MANCDNSGHQHSRDGGWALIKEEFVCHFPYAVVSVAIGLMLLGFTVCGTDADIRSGLFHDRADMLFHCFHFMHLLFAVTGALLTFFRYSTNILLGILVGVVSPAFFCMFSDAILPYIAGRMLGVDMHFHLCFVSELRNVLPFMVVGVVNGYILSRHHENRQWFYSIFSHVMHIFVSSLASSFYLVAHGFTGCLSQIGIVFLFLVAAVVIPCTLSDVVVPVVLARSGGKDEEHSS